MAEGRMRPGSVRGLTVGERALSAAVFGSALDAGIVRVLAWPAPWPDRPYVAGQGLGRSWIVYPPPRALADFSSGALGARAVFVHELVHVWQAQSGVNLLLAKLRAGDRRDSYSYTLDDPRFEAMNIEQQAMAVEHAYRLREGGRAPYPETAYAALFPFGPVPDSAQV